jgi:cytochrome oxidase Cu insertion factor (SCO1/SenC/PrrC family)
MSQSKFLRLYLATVFLLIGMLTSEKAISQSIPSFQMQLTNGKIFSSKNLSRTKPVILIYFAPDCHHCRILMDTFFKKINAFKSAQIVLVTFKPLNEVADFEKYYKTHNYQNIKTGKESPVLFFRNYYQLDNTPFTALYDKKGKLIISYKKETPVDDLIKNLKGLK